MTPESRSLFSTGRWTGIYAVLDLEARDVAAMLHPRLRLARQTMTDEGRHPVYVMLGRQSDVVGTWPVVRNFAVSYFEAMLVIPYVRFDGGTVDFLFMPRLYLDAYWPTLLGVYAFGFPKQCRTIVHEPASYVVRGSGADILWEARTGKAAGGDAAQVAQGYESLASVFSQPFVGFLGTPWGEYEIASWMTFTNRSATAVAIDLRLDDDLVHATRSFAGLTSRVVGEAVELVSDWTLSWPQTSFAR